MSCSKQHIEAQLLAVTPSQRFVCASMALLLLSIIGLQGKKASKPDVQFMYGPASAGKTVLAMTACLILNYLDHTVPEKVLSGRIPEKQRHFLHIKVSNFASKPFSVCQMIAEFFLQLPKNGIAVILFDEAHSARGKPLFWTSLFPLFDHGNVPFRDTKKAAAAAGRKIISEVECHLPLLIFAAATPGAAAAKVYASGLSPEALRKALHEQVLVIFERPEVISRIVLNFSLLLPLSKRGRRLAIDKMLNIIKNDYPDLGGNKCTFDLCCIQYVKQQLKDPNQTTRSVEKLVDVMFRATLFEAQDQIAEWEHVRLKMKRKFLIDEIVAFEDAKVRMTHTHLADPKSEGDTRPASTCTSPCFLSLTCHRWLVSESDA